MRRTIFLMALLAGVPPHAVAREAPLPSGGAALNTQIRLCNDIDQPGRAIPACSAVVNSPAPPITRSSAYTNRGAIYARQGDAEKAMGDYNQAITLDKVGSSRVDLQACKLEYSIVSPK